MIYELEYDLDRFLEWRREQASLASAEPVLDSPVRNGKTEGAPARQRTGALEWWIAA